jgi:hypothetical protein
MPWTQHVIPIMGNNHHPDVKLRSETRQFRFYVTEGGTLKGLVE